MKKLLAFLLTIMLFANCCVNAVPVYATDTNTDGGTADTKENKEETKESETTDTDTADASLNLTSPSVVLIEASTGTILYEKNKDEQRWPASITKIMTLVLIYEALDSGKIKLTDEVSCSEHAASMGGSQVYMEPNEKQTVETMIKCISIASANDCCVAMGEYIAGSETEFVKMMNTKAQELGMKNTKFQNCCGLDDSLSEGQHYSSAYDVALMSRELITKHPEISKYSTTWMDTITHVTKKGESEFGLTNTNKLVRTYDGITGLKTGSTSKAKYCLSATACRNGIDLIAVVMGAPEPKARFAEAATMLDYGFANCSMYEDDNKDLKLDPIKIKNSIVEKITPVVSSTYKYLLLKGQTPDKITKKVVYKKNLCAPLNQGATVGEVVYCYDGKKIGSVPVITAQKVKKANYIDCLKKVGDEFFIAS